MAENKYQRLLAELRELRQQPDAAKAPQDWQDYWDALDYGYQIMDLIVQTQPEETYRGPE